MAAPAERGTGDHGLTPYEEHKVEQVKRWLHHVQGTARSMHALRRRYEYERGSLGMLSAVRYGERVSTSGPVHGDDRIVGYLSKLEEIADDMATESAAYAEAVAEARVVFAGIAVPYGYELMTRHWIYGEKWKDVAASLGLSERQVARIAKQAALECHPLLPLGWRDPAPPAI